MIRKDLHYYQQSSYEQWGKANPTLTPNSVDQWFSADTKRLFELHMNNRVSKKNKWWTRDVVVPEYQSMSTKEILQMYGWDKENIKYQTNSLGYRSDELNDCQVLFNGDSHTFGVGLNAKDTFAGLFAEHYNIKLHNIAVPGSDWNHCTQRALYWIPKLKPKYYVLRVTTSRINWWRVDEKDRIKRTSTSTFSEQDLMNMSLREPDDLLGGSKYYPLIDQLNDINCDWNRYAMLELTKKICDDNDCTLVLIEHDFHSEHYSKVGWIESGLARDLDHHGKKWHQYMYNNLLEKNMEIN